MVSGGEPMDMDKFPFRGIVPDSILRDSSIGGKRQMHSRRTHGFIIKLRGTTEYCIGREIVSLDAGQILYVKKGSSYSIREVSPGYSYVVNFDSLHDQPEDFKKLSAPKGLDLAPLAEKMYHRWQKDDLYGALSSLYSLLQKASAPKDYTPPREKQLLGTVLEYLNEHLTEPELDLSVLPQITGVSAAYLRRIFKKACGTAPAGFVTEQRIRLAKQMLANSHTERIAQIALAAGYKDALYFSRLFKKQTGLSPTEYAQMYKQELF